MKKIVVLTGAGISAESGIPTFRTGVDALWEGHSVEDVATPQGWNKNPALVQKFYNERRKAVVDAQPNAAHIALSRLQDMYDVQVVTQNIDNLHEKAGSLNVLHLHGEIMKSRSTANYNLVYDIDGYDIKMGDTCELGSQLRPHIVWFGEDVPMLEKAVKLCDEADMLIVCGTSLNVYPAASLIFYVKDNVDKYVVDVTIPDGVEGFIQIEKKASEGIPELVDMLMSGDE